MSDLLQWAQSICKGTKESWSLQVVPAPSIPAEAEARHERLQWILLKLRRAHMGGQVDAALRALAADDLIAHSVTYDDPIATSEDLPDLLQYHTVGCGIIIGAL